MIRRPPRPRPLPYTALFRSLPLGDVELLLAFERQLPRQRVGRVAAGPRLDLPALQLGDLPDRLVQDRKSTRLNSSHANISSAVFCLKKIINTGACTSGAVAV